MVRLVIESGLDTGAVFDLAAGQHVVGRGPEAAVRFSDESVSRRHAILEVSEDGVTVLDLDSHNGTKVNGQRVKSARVAEGDELSFGDSRCALSRPGAPGTVSVEVVGPGGEQAPAAWSSVQLPADSRRLALLYEVGNAINSAVGLPELLDRILGKIFEVVPAERGVIMLWNATESQWVPAAMHTREPAPRGDAIAVSRSIIDQAFSAGGPLLSDDATTDSRFGASDSIEAFVIRSAICCPLAVRGERLGVIHLDTRRTVRAFTQEDAQLVGAIANQAAIAISNARFHEALRQENLQLRRALGSRHAIIGQSAPIRQLLDVVRRVSPSDATVLVRGESGTGKEVVARTLHELSPRRAKPFVCVNCAAVPETLLESELFGHERGAFTGAIERRVGRFEQANGGTIFLDEIGEMPMSTQAKILRVLQEREFQRVGGTKSLRVDVRLVASTNRDLEAALQTGEFRQDLYYRLKVVEVVLPPLRERREDIPLLCEYFLAEIARDMGRQPPAIDPVALDVLRKHPWPGNVRELRNVLERAMVLGVGDRLLVRHLPPEVRRGVHAREDLPEDLSLGEADRRHIAEVLSVTGWNKRQAAGLLGISRPRLDRKIREHHIKAPEKE
jgi:Nif-specific regulatory protein